MYHRQVLEIYWLIWKNDREDIILSNLLLIYFLICVFSFLLLDWTTPLHESVAGDKGNGIASKKTP